MDVGRVLSLEPDLVVAVREENTREDVEGLMEAGVEVFVGAPGTVAGAIEMLKELAGRVGASEERSGAVLGPIERVHGDCGGRPGGGPDAFSSRSGKART